MTVKIPDYTFFKFVLERNKEYKRRIHESLSKHWCYIPEDTTTGEIVVHEPKAPEEVVS
jgi:hypothetical protein